MKRLVLFLLLYMVSLDLLILITQKPHQIYQIFQRNLIFMSVGPLISIGSIQNL